MIHRGRYLTFRIDTVERADGSRAIRDIAGHPGAVAIVAIDADDRVALVRQWRLPADDALLEIPAGGLDIGPDGSKEDPTPAARRELEEETGLRAGSWRALGSFYSAPGFTDELMHLFLATDLTPAHPGERLGPEEDERLILEWWPWDDAVEAAERGTIRDAKSIVGLFWVDRLRRRGAIRMGDLVRTFEPGDETGVRDVMEAAFPVDRMPGIAHSEIERFIRRVVADPEGTVVALEGRRIVAYCTPRHDDLTVHPEFRRRGHGRRLVPAALEIERRRGHDELRLHVPLHLPGSIAFARSVGMRYRSSLWLFRLGADRTVPRPAFPDDVVVRPWDVERDSDFEAWAAFLTASFEGHPTPLHPKPSVIAAVHAEPDFDPTEILLLSPAADPSRVIAFARVEMITDDPTAPVGEVGLIGVLPAWRGRGLGRELLRWGVTDLRRRGAGAIELAVEAANERATRLYRGHGFEPAVEWPHWVLPVG